MERSAVLEIEQQQRLNEANTLLKQVTNDRLDRFQVLRFLRIWGHGSVKPLGLLYTLKEGQVLPYEPDLSGTSLALTVNYYFLIFTLLMCLSF